jgi:hypothetical protein
LAAGQPHDPADLVESRPPLRTERREGVAQVEGVIGVPVEVRTRTEPRGGHSMHHCSVTQYGQVEAAAAEGVRTALQAPWPTVEIFLDRIGLRQFLYQPGEYRHQP